MFKIIRSISERLPKDAKDLLPWCQKEVYPLLKDLRGMFNVFVDEFNASVRYHGFENRTDSTVSFSGLTDAFSIYPTTTLYNIYFKGAKVEIRDTKTLTAIPDNAQQYVYFTRSALEPYTYTLTSSATFPAFEDTVIVATLYKNSTVALLYEERHGYRRDLVWHEWAHSTIGARWISGFTGTFNVLGMSVSTGKMCDEDIDDSSVGPMTSCVLLYRDPTNSFEVIEVSSLVYKAVADVLKYDNAGTLTSVSVGNFVNYWVYATTERTYPIHVVVGQTEHATSAAAALESRPVVVGFGVKEFAPLYRVSYKQQGAATITYDSKTDIRGLWVI